MKSKSPAISRSRAAATVTGGNGTFWPSCSIRETRVTWTPAASRTRAAEPPAGFVQLSGVAAQGGGARGLEPGRAAADHDDGLRLGREPLRFERDPGLAGGGDVDDAADRAAGHQPADAAHVGADARA